MLPCPVMGSLWPLGLRTSFHGPQSLFGPPGENQWNSGTKASRKSWYYHRNYHRIAILRKKILIGWSFGIIILYRSIPAILDKKIQMKRNFREHHLLCSWVKAWFAVKFPLHQPSWNVFTCHDKPFGSFGSLDSHRKPKTFPLCLTKKRDATIWSQTWLLAVAQTP